MKIEEIAGKLEYVFSLEELARAKGYGFVAEGVAFTEEYYTGGAAFILIPEPTTTALQLEAAKEYLKRNRDVVWIAVGVLETPEKEA